MQTCRGPRRPSHAEAGFSLIELMLVVVIISVLVSVAYPWYMNSVRKGRRSEAIAALTALQQAQERWRANNPQYSAAVANLGAAATTPNGYYAIAIDSADNSNYVLAAQAVAGTSQASDTQCTTLRLQLYNGAIVYGGCNGCNTPNPGNQVSDPTGCWAK